MTTTSHTPRPALTPLVQWLGSNFAEVRAAVGNFIGLTDLGDGTLRLQPGNITVVTGSWLSFSGAVITPAAYAAGWQPVTTAPSHFVLSEEMASMMAGPMTAAIASATKQSRFELVDVPAIPLLGAPVAVPIAWDTPMPDANYDVQLTSQSAQTVIGKIKFGLVAGSITAAGCTAAVGPDGLAIVLGSFQLRARAEQL